MLAALKEPFVEWWRTTATLRKLQDIAVAVLLAPMLLVAYVAWESRQELVTVFQARWLDRAPVLDAAKAEAGIDAFFRAAEWRGAATIALLEIDVTGNRRRILAWRAKPEFRAMMERVQQSAPESPFVGDGSFSLSTVKALFEGRPSWQPSVHSANVRLIVPVPPVYGRDLVGAISIGVSPATPQSDRDSLESQALRWANTLWN